MKKAICSSLFFLVLVTFLFGCGNVDETIIDLKVDGPVSLPVTDKPAMGIYNATGFNGEIWNTKGTSYSSSIVSPYFWYILRDDGSGVYIVVSNPITSVPTCKITFAVAGTYIIFVEASATFKSGKITNAELGSRKTLVVTVTKGQGYRETTITPHIVIDEWYPGHISLDASRTETIPISDKIVGWEWYLDDINFSSQQQAGVSVTEGSHKIRLEVKTLFGFRQYLETIYVYKSGAASVEIKGSTGGSATGGISGGIDNPPYNPLIDDNPVDNTPTGQSDVIVSFNKGALTETSINSEVKIPVFWEGKRGDKATFEFYTDGPLIKVLNVKGLNGWVVTAQGYKGEGFYYFTATCSNGGKNGDVKEAFEVSVQTFSNTKTAALAWHREYDANGKSIRLVNCSTTLSGKELSLEAIDGQIKIK